VAGAAAYTHRQAVGTPAGDAGHAAVVAEGDGAQPAGDMVDRYDAMA
jgi:hypothetical protein